MFQNGDESPTKSLGERPESARGRGRHAWQDSDAACGGNPKPKSRDQLAPEIFIDGGIDKPDKLSYCPMT
jgi:hypothetical protein